MDKIRIAFIKYGGLAAGGTEKLVQALAANLNKERFAVDYFWCEGSPYIGSDFKFPPSSPERKQYMLDKGVNLIQFNVGAKNITVPTHDWVDTNFWNLFDPSKYDMVVSGRAGHSEYPFVKIQTLPIVDVISLAGHVDRQANIVKSVHISEWQKKVWLSIGGNPDIASVVPIFDELPPLETKGLREQLSLSDDTFVFGFHQRAEPGIFSPVPLMAFARLEKETSKKVSFVLLGGANLYREQAKELGIKNIHFLEHTGDPGTIGKFLKTLNVYSHGRRDGETAGLAIIEAMRYGLPVISHVAEAMGHLETIGDAGTVCESVDQYFYSMENMLNDKSFCDELSENAKRRFEKDFRIEACVKKYEDIFEEVYLKSSNNEYGFQPRLATDDWLNEWVAE